MLKIFSTRLCFFSSIIHHFFSFFISALWLDATVIVYFLIPSPHLSLTNLILIQEKRGRLSWYGFFTPSSLIRRNTPQLHTAFCVLYSLNFFLSWQNFHVFFATFNKIKRIYFWCRCLYLYFFILMCTRICIVVCIGSLCSADVGM